MKIQKEEEEMTIADGDDQKIPHKGMAFDVILEDKVSFDRQ